MVVQYLLAKCYTCNQIISQFSMSTGSCFQVLNHDQSDHHTNSMAFIVVMKGAHSNHEGVTHPLHWHIEKVDWNIKLQLWYDKSDILHVELLCTLLVCFKMHMTSSTMCMVVMYVNYLSHRKRRVGNWMHCKMWVGLSKERQQKKNQVTFLLYNLVTTVLFFMWWVTYITWFFLLFILWSSSQSKVYPRVIFHVLDFSLMSIDYCIDMSTAITVFLVM